MRLASIVSIQQSTFTVIARFKIESELSRSLESTEGAHRIF